MSFSLQRQLSPCIWWNRDTNLNTNMTKQKVLIWTYPLLRAKTKFSRLEGDDPMGWFNRVSQFFEFYRTPEDQNVCLASFHMDCEANHWWQWLHRTYKEENQNMTWTTFTDELWARFDPADGEDFGEALSYIQQCGSLWAYQREFKKLGNQVHMWT